MQGQKMRRHMWKFLSSGLNLALILAMVSLFAPQTVWAKQITVTLTLWSMTDERDVPNMPEDISDDLNYNRNVVKISLARELKKIRFEPIAAGKTNFILRDTKGVKINDYVIIVRKK